ncbi:MAG: YciI family protein [Chloroflexota bacterium]
MQYMLLIYADPATYADVTEEQMQAEMARYFALGPEMRERGVYVAGEGLQGVETATTVRVRDGKTLLTDGPFAETKEHLGGFYIVDAKDLDEAIEFAAKIPDVVRGSVEVRPVAVYTE